MLFAQRDMTGKLGFTCLGCYGDDAIESNDVLIEIKKIGCVNLREKS